MNKTYRVAGHTFQVFGEQLCKAVEQIVGFRPFECEEGEPLFEFVEGTEIPAMKETQYTFLFEDVTGTFGRTEEGYYLHLKPAEEEPFHLWTKEGHPQVMLFGNFQQFL